MLTKKLLFNISNVLLVLFISLILLYSCNSTKPFIAYQLKKDQFEPDKILLYSNSIKIEGVKMLSPEWACFTIYFSGVKSSTTSNFEGVGISFNVFRDTLMVVTTIPGGPSEKVGIRAGDRIVQVDEKKTAGIGLKNTEVFDLLRGKKGTKVDMKVNRKGEANLLEFTVIRDKIPINSLVASNWYIETNLGAYEWLFIDELKFAVDDKVFTYHSSPNPSREVYDMFSTVRISEANIFYVDESLFQSLKSANKVSIRLSGKTNIDRNLTSDDIHNIVGFYDYVNGRLSGKE